MMEAGPSALDDDPYLPAGQPYRMMRLVRGNRVAKRCRLRPASGPGHSLKWAYIFDLVDDFERAGAKVPQSITMITNVGTYRIEGFGLDVAGGLYEMLEHEHVLEVVAYEAGRHGAKPNAPYVSAIREVDPEQRAQLARSDTAVNLEAQEAARAA
jgi:hypothetical protein